MKLNELIQETDALTYINSLKVTLTEIKDQFAQIEQHRDYTVQSCEKVKKLIRRADNQYRIIAKIAQQAGSGSFQSSSVSIQEPDAEMEALMEEVKGD